MLVGVNVHGVPSFYMLTSVLGKPQLLLLQSTRKSLSSGVCLVLRISLHVNLFVSRQNHASLVFRWYHTHLSALCLCPNKEMANAGARQMGNSYIHLLCLSYNCFGSARIITVCFVILFPHSIDARLLCLLVACKIGHSVSSSIHLMRCTCHVLVFMFSNSWIYWCHVPHVCRVTCSLLQQR